jgi:hypothetical protein
MPVLNYQDILISTVGHDYLPHGAMLAISHTSHKAMPMARPLTSPYRLLGAAATGYE